MSQELLQQVEELRDRVRDLEASQHRVAELEERLDFTERLLAQRRDVEQLPQELTRDRGGRVRVLLAVGAGLLGTTLGPIGRAWGRRIEARISVAGTAIRGAGSSGSPTWKHVRSGWLNWKSAWTSPSACCAPAARAPINCHGRSRLMSHGRIDNRYLVVATILGLAAIGGLRHDGHEDGRGLRGPRPRSRLGVVGAVIFKGPVGKALGRRIENGRRRQSRRRSTWPRWTRCGRRVMELEERLDFTERMISKAREPERINGRG